MKSLRNLAPENWGLVLSAFASAYGVGLLGLWALPYLMGAMIDGLGIDEAQAGLLLSAEFVFATVASLVVAPAMGRAPRRTLALVGVAIAVVANIFSASIQDIYILTMMRCIAGIGAGLCLASGNACVSSAENPDRMAGQMNVLIVILFVGIMYSYAHVMSSFGLSGLFYALAATQAAMLLFIPLMPQRPPAHHHEHHAHKPGRNLFSMVSVCMMAAAFFFAMRDAMGWSFVERVGIDAGYDVEDLGLLFSAQAMAGIIGPALAAIVGKRFGFGIPLFIGIIGSGLVSLGYVLSESSILIYSIAVMGITLTYFYTLAYITALAAALDRQGRVAAAAGSFLILGVAVGPAVSGLLVTTGGYSLVGWGIGVAVLVTALAALVPLAALRREHQPIAPPVAESLT